MAILFKTIQSKLKNKDGLLLFHPRVVHIANIGAAQLAKEVAEYSSLTAGDVKNTIDNLVTVVTKHLQSSESVTIDGLGTFSLVMRSRGKGAASESEVKASQSTVYVRFSPSSTRNVDGTVATRSLITGVKCVAYKSDSNATEEEEEENNVPSDDTQGSDNNSGSTESGEGNPF